ncbi:PRAME family member 20/21 [Tupaia chinensis]|uniref:PRAME family member 20/21 n=2 Tax=Tupaia chinensis TaxID=246437 RepID=L9L0Q5_TUPCH|nr:PRAME family member 20/21 [Tupaia chinensis]
MEAVATKDQESLIKAMVQAWPFTHLPLGNLMPIPNEKILKATLDGLDMLLFQKVHPRRWKMEVLDLRQNAKQDFCSLVWSGARDACSAKVTRQTMEGSPNMGKKQPLKVFADLCLAEQGLSKFLSCLFGWAEQRKGLVHVHCTMLQILTTPIHLVREILQMVGLDFFEEVDVCWEFGLTILAEFAPYLSQMSNLRKLHLGNIGVIHFTNYTSPERKEELAVQFISQFQNLNLQKLHLCTLSFLKGRLDQCLRCLKTPLQTLKLESCFLTDSDMISLSQCLCTSQLKRLDLSGTYLANLNLEPFQHLLERVAKTLTFLILIKCGITDTQLSAFLPALSRCVRLEYLELYGNPISEAAQERLRHHTAKLSRLRFETYPLPMMGHYKKGARRTRFVQIESKLSGTPGDLGQSKMVTYYTYPCYECGTWQFYHPQYPFCKCMFD